MSKLEELINKLCPNGVEFKTLGDIATYRRGSFPQPYTNTSFYGGEDAMPFVQVADIKDDGFKLKDKTKQTISKIAQPKSIFVPKGTVICSIQGTIGRVAITQYDSYVDRTIAIFESLNNKIDKKFFAYCIEVKFEVEKQFARGSTLKTITKEEFTKFSIPVPPLEVQCEIVRILDNFTLLSAELSAELSARQKQYNFYRDELLNKIDKFEIKNLEDCCNILDNKRKPVTKSSRISGNIPYYGANGIQDYVSEYIFDGRFVLVGEDGSVVNQNGNPIVNWAEGKIWVNNHAHIIEETIVDLRYLYYYIQTINVRELIHGNIPKLNQRDFRKLKIKVPSKEKQKEITDILDRFDKLCNDISEGLPAEIEARKKQYEYYRDKLLTFKELK
ncbi:restriction endonuclease subunit S [Campylobacter lanienae]|uniref:restriction endonuclease subunit S n=1 Tax=Campylobacter lanienae TaxID=75658 RepID=UPI000BB4508E|nr:restriction endonuclease subunit S [Campylobacter lanienae]